MVNEFAPQASAIEIGCELLDKPGRGCHQVS